MTLLSKNHTLRLTFSIQLCKHTDLLANINTCPVTIERHDFGQVTSVFSFLYYLSLDFSTSEAIGCMQNIMHLKSVKYYHYKVLYLLLVFLFLKCYYSYFSKSHLFAK